MTRCVVVIGSGPAGVSAAWPLVEAGVQVTMIDAGDGDPRRIAAGGRSLAELRAEGGPDAVARFAGADRRGLVSVGHVSPKLRIFGTERVDIFRAGSAIQEKGFKAIGAWEPGGLSNVWGAACSAYDDTDLAGFPIGAETLQPHYRETARRVGISGCDDDDMSAVQGRGLPLQPPLQISAWADRLLRTYAGRRDALAIKLGRSRSMVLTEDHGVRHACSLDGMCLWGCGQKAIYNSGYELADLTDRPNFHLVSGFVVDRIVPNGGGYSIHGYSRSNGQAEKLDASVIMLAAGAIASTKLAFLLTERFDIEVPILNTPCVAFAMCMPARIGSALDKRGFGMAQLSFTAAIPDRAPAYSFGQLYGADSVAAADIMSYMPLSLRGARRVVRGMLSSIVLGLLYFPSEFSRNTVNLRRRSTGEAELVLTGGEDAATSMSMRRALKDIGRDFRRLGMYMIPGTMSRYEPGVECHVGGSLPMGSITTSDGELKGAENVFVTDGAVLNRLPAKHHTFTVMANARRIGTAVAQRLARESV